MIRAEHIIKSFEGRTVLKDIKAGRVTTNVKILAWADLADTQPIGKSGMPARFPALFLCFFLIFPRKSNLSEMSLT